MVDFNKIQKVYIKKVVPVILCLLFGYLDYAVCYVLGYEEVYRHHSRGAAIVQWVLLGFFQFSLYFYWLLILIKGPGGNLKIKPFDIYDTDQGDLTPVPDYFICDENGFPFWCSTCQSIKPPRSVHLGDLNYCVPKLDHYCIWIGTVVGQSNYLLFIKFLQFINAFSIVSLVYLGCFLHPHFARHSYSVNLNYVASIIICAFILIMGMTLLGAHIKYICLNMTTVDDLRVNLMKRYQRWKQRYHKQKDKGKDVTEMKKRMPRKETGKLFVNLKYQNSRVVVEYYLKDRPYNFGFKKNLINLIMNHNLNSGSMTQETFLYSNFNFAKAILVFTIPYYDIPFILSQKSIPNPDTVKEHFPSYGDNCDGLSNEFLHYLITRIDEGKYSIPKYLQAQASATQEAVLTVDNNTPNSSDKQNDSLPESFHEANSTIPDHV